MVIIVSVVMLFVGAGIGYLLGEAKPGADKIVAQQQAALRKLLGFNPTQAQLAAWEKTIVAQETLEKNRATMALLEGYKEL